MAEITLNKQHPLYQEDLDFIGSVKGIESLSGKSVLISGATGLIGVCLIDALMKLNSKGARIGIWAVGRNQGKASSRLGEYFSCQEFHFLEQDVRDPFPTGLAVDYIIPLASNTHPLAYSQYPIETMMINIKGCENALELAARCDAEILYPSSVEIYGNAYGADVFEEDYTGRLNLATSRACYTESKRTAEAMCQSYLSEKGVKSKIVRLSRVFGPTMLESDSKASSQFIKKALAKEDIILKSKGDQFFSYTYVAEAVAAMLHVMINGEAGQAYNISNAKCDVHLRDFAELCAEIAGTKVIFDLPSETEQKGYSLATVAILDNGKLLSSGFKTLYRMFDALQRTMKIVKE